MGFNSLRLSDAYTSVNKDIIGSGNALSHVRRQAIIQIINLLNETNENIQVWI